MSAFKRKRTITLADGTRRHLEDETYTIKFQWQGRQVTLQTGCTSRADADRQQRDLLRELRAGRIPDLLSRLRQRHSNTLSQLLAQYRAAGFPDDLGQPRDPHSLHGRACSRRVDLLCRWAGSLSVESLTDAHQDQYHHWRITNIQRRTGSGNRAVELELGLLRSALDWAVRRSIITRNPITRSYTYHPTGAIRHARDFMPESGDELHRLAGHILGTMPTCACYAWELLLCAVTGLRHSEARQLRAYPQRIGLHFEPGYMDDRYLIVTRAKHGRNPQVQLDDPLRPHIRPLLDQVHRWHATTHPDSPWLLCQRTGQQLSWQARLTAVLTRAAGALGLPPRHAHGLRAYYASCRLAQGISFDQVAFELGQRSGEDLIHDVYGTTPAEWRGLPNTYTWLPADLTIQPAWTCWQPTSTVLPMPTHTPCQECQTIESPTMPDMTLNCLRQVQPGG